MGHFSTLKKVNRLDPHIKRADIKGDSMSDKPEISAMADEFAAETREWLESFDALLAANGPERAQGGGR